MNPLESSESAAEERVVLVDVRGGELRDARGALLTAGKLEAHQRGLLHRAVSVFVFDGTRLLLQRRAATKYHSPRAWTNTCCTHPRPGETPLDSARRRLAEEMGIACELVERFTFVYRAEVGRGLVEHEHDHVFTGEWSGPPRPDPTEVDAWRWVELDDLRRELEREPERFTPWLARCLERASRSHIS